MNVSQYLKRITLLCILLTITMSILAQEDAACPIVIEEALDLVSDVCDDIEKNQVCYGNASVLYEVRPNYETIQFDNPGDIVNIEAIQSLQLSPIDSSVPQWGVALMSVQANLPNTLPGQYISLLLFGDVELVDKSDTSIEIPATSNANVNVRRHPTTSVNNVIASLSYNQEILANGRLEDNSWIRIILDNDNQQMGWVSSDFLSADTDFDELNIVYDPTNPAFDHMQAFYFRSGIGSSTCHEAPEDGLLIQTPEGMGTISLLINDVLIELGSTVFVQAQADGFMKVHTLEGDVSVTANGSSTVVPAGMFAQIELDSEGRAMSMPWIPQAYDAEMVNTLPVNTALPEEIDIAPPRPLVGIQVVNITPNGYPAVQVAPESDSAWRGLIADGTIGTILEGPIHNNGFCWYKIRWASGYPWSEASGASETAVNSMTGWTMRGCSSDSLRILP